MITWERPVKRAEAVRAMVVNLFLVRLHTDNVDQFNTTASLVMLRREVE